MKFMVEIKLPKYKNNHFQSLIPDQQQQIGDLMQQGVINMFSFNVQQTKVWFVINAEGRDDLQEVIDNFVTRRFMLKINIEPLMVHDSGAYQLPPLVMN